MPYSLWSQLEKSWNADGGFDYQPHYYNPAGRRAAYIGRFGKPGREGLLHTMKREVGEWAGFGGNSGMIWNKGNQIQYGGNLFSRGGMREIAYGTQEISKFGTHSNLALGARRSLTSMGMRAALKAAAPAIFVHQAVTQGIGTAVEEAAIFGALKWGVKGIASAIGSPLTVAAGITVGGAFAMRAGLQAGRDYNKKLRIASMGTPFQDTYGNAATIRRASVLAIQSSKMNGRSALGNEGLLLHM